MGMTVALAVVASPVKSYTDAAAAQLADRAAYQRAVLGDLGNSTRPYTGER
jgi:multicomponent K+:H+ antiporter subunit D